MSDHFSHSERGLRVLAVLLVGASAVAATGCAHIGKPQTIYIARHGQTEWNRVSRFQGDPDLDPVGYVHRAGLYLMFKDARLDTIYASEKLRTRRTAELVARQQGLPILQRAALNEIDSGALEGICYAQVLPTHGNQAASCVVPSHGSSPEAVLARLRPLVQAAWNDKVEGKLPMGQSFRELAAQVGKFVDELERGEGERDILVVSHGVVNRTLLHHLMGWPLESVVDLRQENDQVYKIERKGNGVALSMMTPGFGWQPCKSAPPAPGQKLLDCYRSAKPAAAPAAPPAPTSAPAAPPAPPPAADAPAADGSANGDAGSAAPTPSP